MRAILAASALMILLPMSSQGQAVGDVYVRSDTATIPGILMDYDHVAGTCGTTGKDIGKHAKLVFSKEVDNTRHLVVLKTNTDDDNMATRNAYYCLSKAHLSTYFKREESADIGVLTVPFKLRFGPTKLMAGGTLGAFIGKRFDHSNNFSSTLLGFASLTNVPLNDINANVPQTKWGMGIGAGYVITVAGDFQVGLVSGIDVFEGVEDWPYKFAPWVSISIGYAFLSRPKDTNALATAR